MAMLKMSKTVWGRTFNVVLFHEDDTWVAECIDLQGCVSGGKTKAKAISMIKDAIECYLEALEIEHVPIPEGISPKAKARLVRVKV